MAKNLTGDSIHSSLFLLAFHAHIGCPPKTKGKEGKGGRINKGEKGFPVVFWKWVEVEDLNSESGNKQVPFLKDYTVFNLEQTEGIEIPKPQTRNFHPIREAEKVIHEISTSTKNHMHITGHRMIL